MPKINPLAVVLHLVGWTLFLSLPIVFIASQSQASELWPVLFSADALIFFATYLFIFYFHSYYLFPKVYLRKKMLLYAGTLLLMLAAVSALRPFDRIMRKVSPHTMQGNTQHPPPRGHDARRPDDFRGPGPLPMRGHPSHPVDFVSIFLLLMTLTLSISLQFRQQARVSDRKALKADADKAQAELFLLKAQIHPHFLFNTLNNIYSMAVRKEGNTAQSILKLSNILRYTTEDASNNFVPLSSEVEFLNDYVDLQSLRLGDKMNIDLQITGKNENKQIAPFILLTFVENAFKYGVSNHEPSLITIHLDIMDESIQFLCENNLFQTPRNAERTGIGLINTRKRLDQLYPNAYALHILSQNGKYTVVLTLPS